MLLVAGLKNSQAGCANGDNPPAIGTRLGNGGCGFGADLTPFTMHLVIFDIISCHRQESARANMQRDWQNACAGGGNGFGQIIGEMQSGCWRRHRPTMAGKHGLVILPIGWFGTIWAGDIGRQRHAAITIKTGVKFKPCQTSRIGRIDKAKLDIAAVAATKHRCGKIIGKNNHIINAAFLGRFGENAPNMIRFTLMKRHADFRLPTPPLKAGRDHLGIIDNQNITCTKQCWHIANMAVGNANT